MRDRRANLMAAMTIALMGAGFNVAPAQTPRRRTDAPRSAPPPRHDDPLAREIAEHNAAVERRKAEKKARKRAGTAGDRDAPSGG